MQQSCRRAWEKVRGKAGGEANDARIRRGALGDSRARLDHPGQANQQQLAVGQRGPRPGGGRDRLNRRWRREGGREGAERRAATGAWVRGCVQEGASGRWRAADGERGTGRSGEGGEEGGAVVMVDNQLECLTGRGTAARRWSGLIVRVPRPKHSRTVPPTGFARREVQWRRVICCRLRPAKRALADETDRQTARQPDSSPALDKHWTALGSRLEPTRCWRAHAWPYST